MVVSYSQLLAKEYQGKLDEKANQYITYAVDGALRMQSLLKAMRQYWQAVEEPGDLNPTDSNSALDDALKNLEPAIQASSAVITRDVLPEVFCNRSWMTQLFQNLVGNALKYKNETAPRVHLSAERVGPEWVFSVSDNGIGIESQHLPRIFGMLKRLHGRQFSGDGIGLALFTKIVERCGGRIWAESEAGHVGRLGVRRDVDGRSALEV